MSLGSEQLHADQPAEQPIACARLLRQARMLVQQHVLPAQRSHGNQTLDLNDTLTVLLCAFFNPSARSLRPIDAMSESQPMRDLLSVARTPRSTLSDAMKRFDPERVRPLIEHLQKRIPHLKRLDGDLEHVTRKVLAADGSYFNLAGEVVTALRCARGSTGAQSRIRLNLQLDISTLLPVDCDVSGQGDGCEAKAFMRRLQSGVIYVVDRNFVNFGFINAVLQKQSNLVLRLKKNINFLPQASHEPCQRDRELNVRSDQTGVLAGMTSPGNLGRPSRTGLPPTQTLRRVVVWDEKNNKELILLTDLLEVPAYVIAALYRQRWQIELFLRWLREGFASTKVFASMDHLINFSPAGLTLQFYAAIIATLLTYLRTGQPVGKHTLAVLQMIACGWHDFTSAQPALARIARERQLSAARRAKKKSA